MSLYERYKIAKFCWNLAKEVDPAALARTRVLVHDYAKHPHSGEWKRHQVYSLLIKEFPHLSRKSLALTIEVCKCCG